MNRQAQIELYRVAERFSADMMRAAAGLRVEMPGYKTTAMDAKRRLTERETARLRTGSAEQLIKQATALGISVKDYPADLLARLCAERMAEIRSKHEAAAEPLAEFQDLESGPMDSLPDEYASLSHEILERWIEASGGLHYFNGNPTDAGRAYRQYGRALVAVLEALEEEGKLPLHEAPLVIREEDHSPDSVRVQILATPHEKIRSQSAMAILTEILPKVVDHFLSKNADYGDQHRDGLGVRAEFVGIHRKVYKLRRVLWEKREMNHEGAEEMLTDLIGACLIALDLLTQSEA